MRPAETITDVRAVVNLREPDKPWRLMWQHPMMPAPAFEYYETKAEADAMAERSARGYWVRREGGTS